MGKFKEKYNQIIDGAWKKYLYETRFTSNPEWLESVPVMDFKTGEKGWYARQYHRNGFINKCKTDNEFSEKWGLKIDERELSLQERKNLYDKSSNTKDIFPTDENGWNSMFDDNNIPTKLITLTYNNEKTEIYE